MALNDSSAIARKATVHEHHEHGFPLVLTGAVLAHRLVTAAGAQATAGSTGVIGVLHDEKARAIGDTVYVMQGPHPVIADDVLAVGQRFKAGDGGRAVGLVDADTAGDTIKTTGAGVAFTNQPANDGLEILSSNAGDTTQTVTVIGTTQGTDTVVVETVTLTGTTPVATTKVDWGVILAVKKSAATLGTVTVREASADQTVTAGLTAAVLSVGVETITAADQQAYNVAPTAAGSGATTKQIGLGGTDSAGTQIYDSQALNGTTAVTMNTAFKRVTEVYTGDLEAARTAVIKVGAAEDLSKAVGRALTAATAQGDRIAAFVNPV
jgi:hypothetical protein